MRKTAVAVLALAASLGVGVPVHAQMTKNSFEVSPNVSVLNTSATLGSETAIAPGLRFSWRANRWWEFELAWADAGTLPVNQPVGERLVASQNKFGIGVWDRDRVFGLADSSVTTLDLNAILNAKPLRRRWVPYGTVGIGYGSYSGRMTQEQTDSAFPLGPNPVLDAFDADGDGILQELVPEFTCPTCITVISDPNQPGVFVPDRDLGSFRESQWNIGGGVRWLLNDLMSLRFDLRQVTGLGISFSEQVLSAGLSFRLGGEPPIDDDADGVPSYRDACPDTPAGATVNAQGCPSDSDGDKVLDGLDACAATPEGWPVDAKGCPLDTDGDGVPDGRDKCPSTVTGAVVDFEGCPVDSDGDGVPDGIDQCAQTPKGAKVDAKGCPVDSDGDGVPDGIDQCAGTKKGLPVDAVGCTIDSDGDGLKDDKDECPAFAGPGGVDARGCPRLRLDKERRIALSTLTFVGDTAKPAPEAQADLDALIAAMTFYPGVTILIEGHTDSLGAERENFQLSLDRARAVRDRLVEAGIDPNRITTKGYGEKRPVDTNETEEGRAKNRRIEIVVTGTGEAPAEGEAPRPPQAPPAVTPPPAPAEPPPPPPPSGSQSEPVKQDEGKPPRP